MICVAISDKNTDKCLKLMDSAEMAEIRLDLTGYSLTEIEKVFSHPVPKIATCRADKTGLVVQREKLMKAIELGSSYVDIEIEVPDEQRNEIVAFAREHNCRVIISYHNFENTPPLQELFAIANDCYSKGADVAKVVTTINNDYENACILALYSLNRPMVALGMGEKGKITRIIAPFMGAEFSFAASDEGAGTAPGQITNNQMKQIVTQIKNIINQ